MVEFLAVFLGVSLSFLAEGWRESRSEARQGIAVLQGIEPDLGREREAIGLTLTTDSLAMVAGEWLHTNWSRRDVSRDSIDLMLNATVRIGPMLTIRAAYESAKTSGRLDVIGDDELRADVVTFYEQDQVDLADMARVSTDYIVEMIRALRPYVELEGVAGPMRWSVSGRWSDLATNTDVKNAVGQATEMRALAVSHERAYLDRQSALRDAVARELASDQRS